MLVKSCVLGAVLVSTPLCLLETQDPVKAGSAPSVAVRQQLRTEAELRQTQRQLELVRRELAGARRDVSDMRRQLTELLDGMDARFASSHGHSSSCSPSRATRRELMSHYQWLDSNRHSDRAEKALALIVDRAGNDVRRLNSLAWDLMTDKDTAGKFDRIALALAERMEQAARPRRRLSHTYLDTMALARFLNGQVEQAIALQERAIASGGSGDEYRRKLRTYQAAQAAIVAAAGVKLPAAAADTIVAKNEDDDE